MIRQDLHVNPVNKKTRTGSIFVSQTTTSPLAITDPSKLYRALAPATSFFCFSGVGCGFDCLLRAACLCSLNLDSTGLGLFSFWQRHT